VELLRRPLKRVVLHVIDIHKTKLFLYLWPLPLSLILYRQKPKIVQQTTDR
jgi:hypothetical protein